MNDSISRSDDEIRARFTAALRRDLSESGYRREVEPPVWRYIDEQGRSGMILYSDFGDAPRGEVDRVIERETAYFSGIGQNLEWKLFDYDDRSDLPGILRDHRFTFEEPEAVMVLETVRFDHAFEGLTVSSRRRRKHFPCLPGGNLRPRRITDPDEIYRVRREIHLRNETSGSVLVDVSTPRNRQADEAADSDRDDELARVIAHRMTTDPDSISIFAVYDEGRPAAVGWTLYFRTLDGAFAPFAGLYGGATIPEYRRRGLYTGLVFARAREALERKIPYLVVDAGAMSEPILRNLGFRRIATAHPAISPLAPSDTKEPR
jgi:hypothetical protein